MKYPYDLQNSFFINLEFFRVPSIPTTLHLDIEVQIKVERGEDPKRLQVNLRMDTVKDQPLKMIVELVGIFSQVLDQPEPDNSLIRTFVEASALPIMWSQMSQMVRTITANMGVVTPLSIEIPTEFDLPELEIGLSSSEDKEE